MLQQQSSNESRQFGASRLSMQEKQLIGSIEYSADLPRLDLAADAYF